MTENGKRVAKLRELMKAQGIDAYVIPTADFHQSEYVGEHFKARAYVLRGIVNLDGEEKPIKLISMQNPVTSLKHKFLRANGTFTEITDKVISLRTSIDVIIMESTVYMLTLAGENLFNMERAYKAACTGKLVEIERCGIVTDFAAFSSVAGSGHNPRKFVSFNDAHLQKLKNARSRAKMARKFKINKLNKKKEKV